MTAPFTRWRLSPSSSSNRNKTISFKVLQFWQQSQTMTGIVNAMVSLPSVSSPEMWSSISRVWQTEWRARLNKCVLNRNAKKYWGNMALCEWAASYDWKVVGLSLLVSEVHSITVVSVHHMCTTNLQLHLCLSRSRKHKHTPCSIYVHTKLVLSSVEELSTI